MEIASGRQYSLNWDSSRFENTIILGGYYITQRAAFNVDVVILFIEMMFVRGV